MDGSSSRQTSPVEVSPDVEVDRRGTRAGPPALDFRTIFELEAAYVARTLRRLGVDAADVEDMAHEVFLAVHRQLGDYDPRRPLKPWLFGFAFRIASHYRRRSSRPARPAEADAEIADPATPVDEELERAERRQLVLDALEGIELGRRAVFVMVELDGIAAPAIAETLGIPLPTVHSRLRLARQDFAKSVQRLRARRGTP
jgi:RNA polymerase sigma-70 factor (ECF subfamily)